MLTARGVEGTRVLQGLVALGKKHSLNTLEKACETAVSYGSYRLQTIRKLLSRDAVAQQPLPFLDEHPIIRPLDGYGAIVQKAFQHQQDRASLHEGFRRHGSGVQWVEEKPTPTAVNTSESAAPLTRPRSGYPSPGRSPAEPDSVSPDSI